MKQRSDTRLSRFLSLVLRHQPEVIDLELSYDGWASIPELLAKSQKSGRQLNRATIERIVADDTKQRYTIDIGSDRIRANQGHSIKIDLGLEPIQPQAVLFHGTATRFLDSIMATGLERRSRQYVHLSADLETAKVVGKRHGTLAILEVAAAQMAADGLVFYRSANGVWLTNKVPTKYLKLVT